MAAAEEDCEEEAFFNVLLRESRIKANLAQYVVADEAGVSVMSLSFWETGQRLPRRGAQGRAAVERVSAVLGVDLMPAYLYSVKWTPVYHGGSKTKTHCSNGHPYDTHDVYGHQRCSICRHESVTRAAKKAHAADKERRRLLREQGLVKSGPHLTTACRQGHLWTDENTYISPSGDRGCRACARRRDAGRAARRVRGEH